MEWASKYQTLIVGALGFGGVIVTLLVNAYMQRRQHDRLAEHERATVRRALLAELAMARNSMWSNIQKLREPARDLQAFVPKGNFTRCFDAILPKIGVLLDTEAGSVIEAYANIREFPDRLRLFTEPRQWTEAGVSLEAAQNEIAALVLNGVMESIDSALNNLRPR